MIVHREVDPVRLAGVFHRGSKSSDAGNRKCESDCAADETHHDALDQKLPNDTPAACSQSRADCGFARPSDRSRKQQVRHVGAGDQQHKSNGPLHRKEDSPDLAAVEPFVERHQDRFDVFIGIREGLSQALRDRLQFGAGLLRRNTRPETSEHVEVSRIPVLVAGSGYNRQPYILDLRESHPFGHDANDSVGLLIDLDRPSDRILIAAVSRLPKTVTDQGDRGCGGRVFAGTEISATEGVVSGRAAKTYWR